ncbi:MAG: hypothetical protein NVS4B11_38180 [Ktedonobacteraceae bacterium]
MNIDPNNNLGYWLFYAQRCVAYAFSEVMHVYCVEHGKPYIVTPPQWGVLALLYQKDNLTIGTISQKRGVDAPTITGIIKRLEQSGLVERRHDCEDRRVVKVYLTDEGRSITQSLKSAVKEFNDEMLRNFSQDEQDEFLTKLQQIIANVSSVAMGTGDRFGLLPERIVLGDFIDRNE